MEFLLGDVRQAVEPARTSRGSEEDVHDVEGQRVGKHADVLRDIKHAVVLDFLVLDQRILVAQPRASIRSNHLMLPGKMFFVVSPLALASPWKEGRRFLSLSPTSD